MKVSRCSCSIFSVNFEYILTRPGLMKLVTLILGLLSLGLGIHGTADSVYNERSLEELADEETFESSVSLCVVISFFYLLLLCFSIEIASGKKNRIVDTVYHILAGQGLIAAGLLLIVSAIEIENSAVCKTYNYFRNTQIDTTCQLYNYKMAGGIFSLINAMVYIYTAYVVYTAKVE